MFFKNLNKYVTKIIALTLVLYISSSVFIIVNAENYEWTIIDNTETVETTSKVEEESVDSIDTTNSGTDELNLECESAILIEQTTRSNSIPKKCR